MAEQSRAQQSQEAAALLGAVGGAVRARVKLGSCCSTLRREGTAVSVAGVHREVSEQTPAINKSEVYSHYLGLLFRILVLMAHRGGVRPETLSKNKGKCSREKKEPMWHAGRERGSTGH